MKKTKDEYSVGEAIKKGDLWTRLSMIFFGAGLFGHKQKVKGAVVFLLEVSFNFFMANTGIAQLAKLPSLGDTDQIEVWNEAKGVYEYTAGDNSLLILLYGVVTLFVIAAIVTLWI